MGSENFLSGRRVCRELRLGGLMIGHAHPVSVQSMTTTDTADVAATVGQIKDLTAAGCEIVRLAVPNQKAAAALGAIRSHKEIAGTPLVADIHFDSRLAVSAVEAGMDGLRINPGNIGGPADVDRVVDAARAHHVPIRIGVNSGSVQKDILEKHGAPTPAAMVESALTHLAMLEARGFYHTKLSIKSSSVSDTIAAYRLLAASCDYPLHVGVTEAGSLLRGAVKSSLALGRLLSEGIGDTIRVSLTEDPLLEVAVAWEILRSLGLRSRGVEVISCPTCGRCRVNLISLAHQVEEQTKNIAEVFSVAVMGCVVNGPGEAAEADLGIACGYDSGVLFRKGRPVGRVEGFDNLLPALMAEIAIFLKERRHAK